MDVLAVREGVKTQREGESLAYSITTTPWGTSPGTIVCSLWDITDATNEVDVTLTKLTGSTSVLGDVVTTKKVFGLVEDHRYRLDVSFAANGNTWVVPVIIKGVR